jgi:hypothetical protein
MDLAGKSWALYSLRILIVFAIADISLRYVELPVRRGVVSYWIKGLKYRTEAEKQKQTRRVVVSLLILILGISLVSFRAIDVTNKKNDEFRASLEVETATALSTGHGIWLTGDSVILGIKNKLSERFPVGLVNARVGRQADELLDVITHDSAHAPDGPIVLNLGNNNALLESQVMAIFEALKGTKKVIVINTAVPRPWKNDNNELIARIAAQYPAVRVIDWSTISEGHPEYFAPDGVHLVGTGVDVYVEEIAKYLS